MSIYPLFLDFLPIQVTTEHWVEFSELHSRFSLVIYFIQSINSVYTSIFDWFIKLIEYEYWHCYCSYCQGDMGKWETGKESKVFHLHILSPVQPHFSPHSSSSTELHSCSIVWLPYRRYQDLPSQEGAKSSVQRWIIGEFWWCYSKCLKIASSNSVKQSFSLLNSTAILPTCDLVFLCTCCIRRRRQWQPNPVLLPGKSHGWRSLEGCSPWGC